MRGLLDALYRISGFFAALSLVGIAVIVFGQVFLNLIDYLAMHLLGVSYSLLIPSYAMLSGYALAFATFLSLGLGLRRAAHIRITLLESKLPSPIRRGTLIVVCLSAVLMGVLFTVSLGNLAMQSYEWGDKASGLLRIPLWIPQSVLCFGVFVFLIAAIDTLVEILRTGQSEAFRDDSPAEEVL
ncbi:TRAP transporter small permease [Orrella sp. 11846]|uniref:TRAP transporter small permease n=1 Tax=Orrella sp. 11846 TaxID=3409913 RepID=UPI003B59DF43